MITNTIATARLPGGTIATTIRNSETARVRPVATVPWRWPLPSSSLLAVLDDRGRLSELVDAFMRVGIAPTSVWAASGQQAVRELEAARTRGGLTSRLAVLNDDAAELTGYLAARCHEDAALLLVRASRRQMEEVSRLVQQHAGKIVRRTGRLTFSYELGR